MKPYAFILLIGAVLLGITDSLAQEAACESNYDKESAMKKAGRFGVKITPEAKYWSGIKLDTANCEWEVWSMKTKHITRGDCKHTNGCTLFKEIRVILDARSGKLKSRKRVRRKIHNYE